MSHFSQICNFLNIGLWSLDSVDKTCIILFWRNSKSHKIFTPYARELNFFALSEILQFYQKVWYTNLKQLEFHQMSLLQSTVHHSQSIASCLYLLKIFLYHEQFKTSPESTAHTEILTEYRALQYVKLS